jgi:hypothetical protein
LQGKDAILFLLADELADDISSVIHRLHHKAQQRLSRGKDGHYMEQEDRASNHGSPH